MGSCWFWSSRNHGGTNVGKTFGDSCVFGCFVVSGLKVVTNNDSKVDDTRETRNRKKEDRRERGGEEIESKKADRGEQRREDVER